MSVGSRVSTLLLQNTHKRVVCHQVRALLGADVALRGIPVTWAFDLGALVEYDEVNPRQRQQKQYQRQAPNP